MLSRRDMLMTLLAGLAVMHARLLRQDRRLGKQVFPLQYASAFSAPFITNKLLPGARLEIRLRGQRQVVYLGSHVLGYMPPDWGARQSSPRRLSAVPSSSAALWAISRNSRGRLRILVKP